MGLRSNRIVVFLLVVVAAFAATHGVRALLSGKQASSDNDLELQFSELLASSRFVLPRLSLSQAPKPCRKISNSGLVADYACDGSAEVNASRLLINSLTRRLERSKKTLRKQAALLELVGLRSGAESSTTLEIIRQHFVDADSTEDFIDLSAAYFLAAMETDRPSLLVLGLHAAEDALAIQPDRPEALFNRALLLEALSAKEEARRTWQELSKIESADSPWRSEIEENASRLEDPSKAEAWAEIRRNATSETTPQIAEKIADDFPGFGLEWFDRELLPRWADTHLQRDARTARLRLQDAATLANAFADRPDERMPFDLVQQIRTADNVRLDDIALSILDLEAAMAAYDDANFSEAALLAGQASKRLDTQSDALRLHADFRQATALDQLGDKEEAIRITAEIVQRIGKRSYHRLRGRALATQARAKNNRGRPEESIPILHRAAAELRKAGDAENGSYAESLLADSYWLLGDFENAWIHTYSALALIRDLGRPQRELQTLNGAADFTLRSGESRLSFYYQDATVALISFLNNPDFAADVLLWRSLLYFQQGNTESAAADLDRAHSEGNKIPDPRRHERFRATLGLVEGAILHRQDPAAAIFALDSSAEYFQKARQWSNLLLVHRTRAAAHGYAGDLLRQEQDLLSYRRLYSEMSLSLRRDSLRIALADQLEGAFDQMLKIQIQKEADPATLFRLLEEERSLTNPQRVDGKWISNPASLTELFESLPERTAFLRFAVLSDRILLCGVRSHGIHCFETPLEKSILLQQIRDLNEQNWKSSDWSTSQRELTKTLFGQIQGWLDEEPTEALYIAPDDALFGVPFAALQGRSPDRFLLEDFAVAVVPSAGHIVRTLNRSSRSTEDHERHALMVAVSSSSDPSLAKLKDLSQAEPEIRQAERLFPGSATRLLTEDATAARLRQHLDAADWLHFAGHAVALPTNPLDSFLVLQSDVESPARLTAQELQDWDLSRLQGVVLSACSTAAAPQDAWPGASTLARPFLAAGVPFVIGSLWRVKDSSSRRFFEVYYDELRRSESPWRTFQQAQIRLLQEDPVSINDSKGWIAFEFFGAAEWTATPN